MGFDEDEPEGTRRFYRGGALQSNYVLKERKGLIGLPARLAKHAFKPQLN